MLPPPVDHVAKGIYISGWRATLYSDQLATEGITNVLKLYDDIPHFPATFNEFENVLDDGEYIPEEVLKRGVDFVVEQVEAGQHVLVMCGAGISRSSTFVLGAMLELGYDLKKAYEVLLQNHPVAAPHPQLWRSLIDHYDLDYTMEEAWDWVRAAKREDADRAGD